MDVAYTAASLLPEREHAIYVRNLFCRAARTQPHATLDPYIVPY